MMIAESGYKYHMYILDGKDFYLVVLSDTEKRKIEEVRGLKFEGVAIQSANGG